MYNYHQEEKRKREEWVASLQAGDEVAIQSGSYGWRSWYICEVIKVTPSGRRNLDNGTVINPDGSIRGNHHTYVYPITDEIKHSIWRKKAIGRASKLDVRELSDDLLKEVLLIIKKHKEETSNNVKNHS